MPDVTDFEKEYAELSAKETFLEADHEEAVERVREAFTETGGFGSPMEFSPSENVREHTGAETTPTTVIGIGNPHAGKMIAEATEGDAAALIPCSVAVRQVGERQQRVYHVNLLRVFEEVGIAPDEPDGNWKEASSIASEGVDAAFEELRSSELASEPPAAD